MINATLTAKLLPENKIRINIFSPIMKNENTPINIIINDNDFKQLKVEKTSMMGNVAIYECSCPFLIELGNTYTISISSFGTCSLDVNDCPFYQGFEDKYYYSGNDLGATYTKDHTTFVVWAPLASKVLLHLSIDGNTFVNYEMNREPKGTYRLVVSGNLDGALYNYIVANSGVVRMATDPYGKGSNANGKNSVVINFKKTNIDLEEKTLPVYKNYVDTIIYEFGVRDFTINPNTNIENKGKYLGLTEEKRITIGGHPAGLDYLKFMGFTHVQLMPIYDFKTIDEENPAISYNWGYDPQQYFVPEGSYSTNPNDPYSRIIELKKAIKALHHNNIKVNMDVVYNHVYEYQTSSLEAIVPNYYFRRYPNGLISNGSGCEDDLASEKRMVSKLIIDACLYWITEYGIDGFRFDLMGIIDKYTLMKIYREAIRIKPDFMFYGEGWNMQTALPEESRSSMNNAKSLPHVAFFNDAFRDIVKGPTGESDFHVKGYLTGDASYKEGFKYVYLGSCLPRLYNSKFISANQSINYVECHDNGTLYDKIVACCDTEEEETLAILRQINACVLISYGVPFFHMGQEIGQSKNMHQNTYISGDKYNMFQYDLLDKRFAYAQCLSSLIKARKLGIFIYNFTAESISKDGTFVDLEGGSILAKYEKVNTLKGAYDLYVFYNITSKPLIYNSKVELTQFISECGYIDHGGVKMSNILIPPHGVAGYAFKYTNVEENK